MRIRILGLEARRLACASSLSLAFGCSLQDFDPLGPAIGSGGAGGDGFEPGVGGDGGSGSNGGSSSNGGSGGDGGSAGTEAQGGSAGTGGGGNGGGGGGGPTEPVELMLDPSFETGNSGWQGFGAASLVRVQTEANTGDYSLLCSNRTDEWHGASIPLPFLTNPEAQYYTVSGWIRLPGPEVDGGPPPVPAPITVSLKTKCSGDLDDTAGELYTVLATVQVDDSWVFFTGDTPVPNRCVLIDKGIQEYRLFVAEQAGPTVFTNFYLDDVSILRVTTP